MKGWQALVVAWLATVLVPDLYVRGRALNGVLEHGRFATAFYVLALAASLWLWVSLAAGLARVRARAPRAAWPLIALSALLLATFTVDVLGYRAAFGLDPRPIVWAYLIENPRYAVALLIASSDRFLRVAVLGTPLLLFATLAYATRGATSPLPRRPSQVALAGSLLVLACYWAPVRRMKGQAAPPDVRGLHTFIMGTGRWLASDQMPTLPVPRRATLAAVHAKRRPDVVLVIHESLSKELVAPWTAERTDVTPKVAALLAEHAAHAVWFAHATTVAPVTNVALPAILTGLSAEAPRQDYARAPLLWEDAQARGYRTALFSAEDYDFSFFRGFFLSDGRLDAYATASELVGAPRVNDRGVEDALVVDRAVAFIEQTAADQPLFLVVQFNATHWPCWAPALRDRAGDQSDTPNVERRLRCTEATRYVDAQQARLWEALARRGRLEQTLLLGTSDHGESFDAARPLRPVSYYDTVLSVPLWIHLPQELVAAEPALAAQLMANRDATVSNLDLYATLLDVWGQWPAGPSTRPALAGVSLLRAVPKDRVLVSTSCSSIYEAASDGFALYRGRWKWVFDDLVGERLFDTTADPGEARDLLERAPPEERAAFLGEIPRHARPLQILRAVDPALAGTAR